MASEPAPVDAELLLAQAGWVRGLVRRLIRDEALAEEVVQDTYVAALERRGSATGTQEPAGLRAWLGAVARNLSLRARRRAFVRRAIENAGARTERIGGGAEEVERMQLQRELASAVLALDEPYRSAVILRHLDGLSHGEIARRQACSVAAARQRVARGLGQLRVRLAREHGGREHWCALFVRLAGPSWSGLALLTGGMLMTWKIVAGVAAGALLALSLWFSQGRRAAEPAPAVELATSPAARVEPERVADVPRTPESTDERGERVALAGQSDPLLLRGTVTDTRGRPLADAAVVFLEQLPVSALTSDDGGFALAVDELATPVRVTVSCAGFLAREAELVAETPTTIALQALPALSGRLFTPDGASAAPPAQVLLEIDTGAGLEQRYATLGELGNVDPASTNHLDALGNFRFDALPLGRAVKLWGRARGFAPSELALAFELEPDRVHAQDLELTSGAVLTGVVRDALTLAPVPGAEVWSETLDPRSSELVPRAVADGNGRYRLEGVEELLRPSGDGSMTLLFLVQARSATHVPHDSHLQRLAPDAQHAYTLDVLVDPAGANLEGLALTSAGAPAADAQVFCVGEHGSPSFLATDAAGAFRLENLALGSYDLWIGAGAETLTTVVELRAPGEQRQEFRLERGTGRIEGRVHGLDGAGVPGLTVGAQLQFRAHGLMLGLGELEQVTDDEGRFAFEGLRSGTWSLHPRIEGSSTPCALPDMRLLEVGPSEKAAAEFTVGACFTLEGQLDGAEALVELELQAIDPASGSWCGNATLDANGRFRFEPMLACEHELLLARAGQVIARWRLGPEAGFTTLVVPR